RSPIVVILVPRERGRQTHLCAEEIYGAGSAIVLAEDGTAVALAGWKFEIGVRDDLRHLLPAELVGIKLWQRPLFMVFDFRRAEVHEFGIGDVLADCEHGEVRERCEDCASREQRDNVRGL